MSRENGANFLHFCLILLRKKTVVFLYSEKWDCQQGKKPFCIKRSDCRRKVVGSHKGLGAQKKGGRFWVKKCCPKKAEARRYYCLNVSLHIARINLFSGMIFSLLSTVRAIRSCGGEWAVRSESSFAWLCLFPGVLLMAAYAWWHAGMSPTMVETSSGTLCTASNSLCRAGANEGIRLYDACRFLPNQDILWLSDLCHLPQSGHPVGRGAQTKQGLVQLPQSSLLHRIKDTMIKHGMNFKWQKH